MARVCADHAHHAFATNDATVLADAANGTTYFHWLTLLFMVEQPISISNRPHADKGENYKKFRAKNHLHNGASRAGRVLLCHRDGALIEGMELHKVCFYALRHIDEIGYLCDNYSVSFR